MIKTITVAICYDFDGTLSPFDFFGDDFLSSLGINQMQFWRECDEQAKMHRADPILIRMKLLLDMTRNKEAQITKKALADFGKNIQLYPGLEEWFDRINEYGWTNKIMVEHYLISSGIKEMIEGSVIQENFKNIFASSYVFDEQGVAIWPAMAVNYMTKTQFLLRINKGITDISNPRSIYSYQPVNQTPIPFSRIIYVGDGSADIPCMQLVKDRGGHSIVVYAPRHCYKKEGAEVLVGDGLASFMATADYRKGKSLDKLIKSVLKSIAMKQKLEDLEGKKEQINESSFDS